MPLLPTWTSLPNLGSTFLGIFVITVTLLYRWWKKPHPNFPPGPRGFPILGVTPYMTGKRAELVFHEWSSKIYGPIMSVRLGTKDAVVLSNYDVMNEALVQQGRTFAGRPPLHVFKQSCKDNGIVFKDYSAEFRRQRNFGIQTLKKFGFAKEDMQELILAETDHLIRDLKDRSADPINLLPLLSRTTANVISTMVIGNRFKDDSPELRHLIRGMEMLRDPSLRVYLGILILFDNSRFLPYLGTMNENIKHQQDEFIDFFRVVINERKARFKKEHIVDFIDAYIYEQKYGKPDGSFTDEQLVLYVRDLLVGGTETSATTVGWAITCLLNYPEYKEPIVKEIRQAWGHEQRPSLEQKQDTPLTQAFLQEVVRFQTVAPFTRRRTLHHTVLHGYDIPKGTQVIGNLYSVSNDPNLWPEPRLFNPYRHIDQDGQFVHSTKIIPFSIGSRYCLGEPLARAEYFLLFASILLHFDMEPVGGPPSMDGKSSNVVNLAPDFMVNLKSVL